MKSIKPIFNLNKEEQAEHNALVKSGYKSKVVTKKRKQEFVDAAKNTVAKNKMITIRVSERTMTKLKAAAMREGLPYQTLVSSLIHKNI